MPTRTREWDSLTSREKEVYSDIADTFLKEQAEKANAKLLAHPSSSLGRVTRTIVRNRVRVDDLLSQGATYTAYDDGTLKVFKSGIVVNSTNVVDTVEHDVFAFETKHLIDNANNTAVNTLGLETHGTDISNMGSVTTFDMGGVTTLDAKGLAMSFNNFNSSHPSKGQQKPTPTDEQLYAALDLKQRYVDATDTGNKADQGNVDRLRKERVVSANDADTVDAEAKDALEQEEGNDVAKPEETD